MSKKPILVSFADLRKKELERLQKLDESKTLEITSKKDSNKFSYSSISKPEYVPEIKEEVEEPIKVIPLSNKRRNEKIKIIMWLDTEISPGYKILDILHQEFDDILKFAVHNNYEIYQNKEVFFARFINWAYYNSSK